MNAYREDIDGLRGVAVASVVLFHAFPEWLRGGFTGVDVFFVISGYLISGIIFNKVSTNSFSIGDFYVRRIKRIFPSLCCVLLVVLAASWFVLTDAEFMQLGEHVVGASTFVSNIVLWREAGYFDAASETKPLLNLWSLGIEEQFYLVWPLLVFAVYRLRWSWYPLVGLCVVASFTYGVAIVASDSVAAFYSPVARVWELLVGSFLALSMFRRGALSRVLQRHGNIASIIGVVLLILSVVLISRNRTFPGVWALLPVVGTTLVIAAGPNSVLNKSLLSHPALKWVGLISYPLYLWHWPLLAYLSILSPFEPTILSRSVVVLFTVLMAWLTYILVEKPIRFCAAATWKVVTGLTLCMVAYAAVGATVYWQEGVPGRPLSLLAGKLGWGYWVDPACLKQYGSQPCQASGAAPEIMILGDSHANHLFPGVKEGSPNTDVISVGTCPPLDGMYIRPERNRTGHPCAAINYLGINKAIIERTPAIRVVVISAFWTPILTGSMRTAHERDTWGRIDVVSKNTAEEALDIVTKVDLGLSRTIAWLLKRGLKVVLVREGPSLDREIVEYCNLRINPKAQFCKIDKSDVEEDRRLETELVRRVRREFPDVAIFDPLDEMCVGPICYLVANGDLYLRDSHHLSRAGSLKVGAGLVKLIGRNWPH